MNDWLSLESPAKKIKVAPIDDQKISKLVDDKRRSDSPHSLIECEVVLEEDLEDLRKKFVGEIDLPESTCVSRFFNVH